MMQAWAKPLPALLVFCALRPGGPCLSRPALSRPVPAFTLPDLGGKPRALADFRGRPVALFFFCDCDSCRRCALAWGEAQRSGALPPLPSVIVFSGDAAAAKRFREEAGLDAAQTTMLTDPTDRIADRYQAPVCPRVFVLNAAGGLRYTNNERGTDPQTMPAAVLVSRIVSAARAAQAPPPGPRKPTHAP